MGRSLAVGVQVGSEFYPAGSAPSAEVAAQITNPKAWATVPEPEGKAPAKRSASRKSGK